LDIKERRTRRFRDRLMFPIRDKDAAVVGFIGRRSPALDDDSSNRAPKYLNSPDTALFSKGRQLYGLSEARDLLVRGALPVLVEGPVDALAVTVGTGGRAVGLSPLGIALTRAQARQLDTVFAIARRDIVVALDADLLAKVQRNERLGCSPSAAPIRVPPSCPTGWTQRMSTLSTDPQRCLTVCSPRRR
jgi:DNA primase